MMKNVLPEIFDESAEESTSASATRAQKRHVSHMFASERPEKCVSRNSTVRPRWRPVFPYPVKISIPPGGGHQKYSRVRQPAGTFSRAFRSRREAPRIGRNAARNSLLQAYTLVPATVSIFLSRGFFQPNQFVRVNIISEIVSATRYKLPILINMLAEY